MALGDSGGLAGPECHGLALMLPDEGGLPAGLGGVLRGLLCFFTVFPSTGCGPFCCSRRGACLLAFLLLLMAMLAALLVVATILGRPPHGPGQGDKREHGGQGAGIPAWLFPEVARVTP